MNDVFPNEYLDYSLVTIYDIVNFRTLTLTVFYLICVEQSINTFVNI